MLPVTLKLFRVSFLVAFTLQSELPAVSPALPLWLAGATAW
jgi:hypothetical protein